MNNKKKLLICALSTFLIVLSPLEADTNQKFKITEKISASVDGLVYAPGTYNLATGSTVQDLVKASGGIKRLGRKSGVVLVRGTGDQLVFYFLDLTKESGISRVLKEGDKLYIELRHL